MHLLPPSSISATDRWMQTFEKQGKNIQKVETMFLNKLPYALLKSIESVIQSHWDSWQPYAENLSKQTKNIESAEKFLLSLTMFESQTRLSQLITLSKRVDNFAINACFLNCKNLEKSRVAANNNLSRGYVEDIDPETIKDIAIEMVKSPKDWRLLGDGLGFNNDACQSFKDPSEIIERWIRSNRDATLCRLLFEVEQLEMESACNIIQAIPLEGVSKKSFVQGLDIMTTMRKVTKYDLLKLNEIFKETGIKIDWKLWAEETISYAIKNNKNREITEFDLLWQYDGSKLNHLLNDLTKKYPLQIKQFNEELRNGLFEPTNAEGITYSQIVSLGNLVSSFMPSDVQVPTFKPSDFNFPNLGFLSFRKEEIDGQILIEAHLPGIVTGSPMRFLDFLVLYWQHPEGEKLNLRQFYYKILELLETTKSRYGEPACPNPSSISSFKKAYDDIKPWRSFDPILAKVNAKKEQAKKIEESQSKAKISEVSPERVQEIAEKVKSIAKPKIEEENSCGICMDRTVNAVIIPCGHLGYCLDCLKEIKLCPTCQTPIANRVQVYNLNQ